ncbi:MAG TPA: hypothetical protein VEK79_02030 [Thermoanaerobaculia bacterium]|nr:hypothetical protein [Thermoanaerobaculia bacterium]
MRYLVVAVTLLSGIIAHAAPTLEFRADHTQIGPLQPTNVYVRNHSEESAFDVEITIAYPDGLELNGSPRFTGNDWTCNEFAKSTTCYTSEFAGGRVETLNISFRITPTSFTGGRRDATVALAARNVGLVGTLRFNVFTFRPYTVTTSEDFGSGSLRDVIEAVNANPTCGSDVRCHISFAIVYPDVMMRIAPATPLPAIRKCNVHLAGPDGDDIPWPEKQLEISGENAHFGNGLEVRASCAQGVPGVTISGLAVHSWPWNGIHFDAPAPHDAVHTVTEVYVGTDRTGLVAKPNRSRGINVDSPHESVSIFRAIASANGRSGIAFWRGKHGSVSETKMGVDRHGQPMGNGAGGFFSGGVPFQLAHNTIAYNRFSGVAIAAGTPIAAFFHNRIHTNANLPIDWSIDNRTADDDESDLIPNAPRVLDAFYDAGANLIRIRGVVRLTAGAFGGTFHVQIYFATTTRGDVAEPPPQFPQRVMAPQSGTADVAFELVVPGDHRGKLVALQTQAGANLQTQVSSEISEALPVR